MSQHDATEADELTKVARDLSEIVAMHDALEDQAIHKATDRLMPGGNAMVMLGHVGSPEAWGNRIDGTERWNDEQVEQGKIRDLGHVEDEDEDWVPPLQSLLFWSEQWRYEHNAATDLTPTVATEAGFLRQILNWAWENESHWEDFAKDVRQARVRVENVLYAGSRPQRTRIPCIDCEDGPRLIRVYGTEARYDGYKCPRCKRRYDHDDYVRAKQNHLASQGAERFVKLQDARDAIDRPERTMRQWIRDGKVTAYCDVVSHQIWCWWPEVREAHLATPRRNRVVA